MNQYFDLATQGNANGEFFYALMLMRGRNRALDAVQAREYYRRAAEQGHLEASYNYATVLYHGEGGARDREGAFEYYRRAAARGHLGAERKRVLMSQRRDRAVALKAGRNCCLFLCLGKKWR